MAMIERVAVKPASKLVNCLLFSRPDRSGVECMFYDTSHGVLANLDGYLIIPKEAFTDRQIRNASKRLSAKTARAA